MYIYPRRGSTPQTALSGLGAEDRYIPPKNVDPVTGRPIPTVKYPVPWAAIWVGLRDINCRFYQDAPRGQVISASMPYTMEISVPGHNFIGSCGASMDCPTSVHQNARPRDPWRIRRCNEWKEGRKEAAAQIIADPEFRANLTERVLDIAGITGLDRYRVSQAEFLEVVQEREARERPIKLFAFIFLAASGGILTFNYVRKVVKRRAARKAVEKAAAMETE